MKATTFDLRVSKCTIHTTVTFLHPYLHLCVCLMFPSVTAFTSTSIPHFVLLLSIKLGYPSSGHVYYSKRTPLNVNETRRVSLFITLFILVWDNNNKNNQLDLNGCKENINILLVHGGFFGDSWTATQLPEEAPL